MTALAANAASNKVVQDSFHHQMKKRQGDLTIAFSIRSHFLKDLDDTEWKYRQKLNSLLNSLSPFSNIVEDTKSLIVAHIDLSNSMNGISNDGENEQAARFEILVDWTFKIIPLYARYIKLFQHKFVISALEKLPFARIAYFAKFFEKMFELYKTYPNITQDHFLVAKLLNCNTKISEIFSFSKDILQEIDYNLDESNNDVCFNNVKSLDNLQLIASNFTDTNILDIGKILAKFSLYHRLKTINNIDVEILALGKDNDDNTDDTHIFNKISSLAICKLGENNKKSLMFPPFRFNELVILNNDLLFDFMSPSKKTNFLQNANDKDIILTTTQTTDFEQIEIMLKFTILQDDSRLGFKIFENMFSKMSSNVKNPNKDFFKKLENLNGLKNGKTGLDIRLDSPIMPSSATRATRHFGEMNDNDSSSQAQLQNSPVVEASQQKKATNSTMEIPRTQSSFSLLNKNKLGANLSDSSVKPRQLFSRTKNTFKEFITTTSNEEYINDASKDDEPRLSMTSPMSSFSDITDSSICSAKQQKQKHIYRNMLKVVKLESTTSAKIFNKNTSTKREDASKISLMEAKPIKETIVTTVKNKVTIGYSTNEDEGDTKSINELRKSTLGTENPVINSRNANEILNTIVNSKKCTTEKELSELYHRNGSDKRDQRKSSVLTLHSRKKKFTSLDNSDNESDHAEDDEIISNQILVSSSEQEQKENKSQNIRRNRRKSFMDILGLKKKPAKLSFNESEVIDSTVSSSIHAMSEDESKQTIVSRSFLFDVKYNPKNTKNLSIEPQENTTNINSSSAIKISTLPSPFDVSSDMVSQICLSG
ncbi:hypothetical protein PACTADRAFT_185280 [Pachysolen tannophilus NRRL Y-2460]|uniref:PH-like domain-containing protein n=1 Tax=Pachysolen tannophilus NRRL Y-2460 TaxID=669874 RepID=A0A1E4U2N8_PACTA|nr:hypothetical protein PACTADRAFT_185280 [Pachysolen tannophilus NRRL Y-2460]